MGASEKSLSCWFGLIVAMLLNALKHVVMLLFVAHYFAVKVRNELHGALCCVIDGREVIDQLPESLVIVVVFPLRSRFGEECRIKLAELLTKRVCISTRKFLVYIPYLYSKKCV